MSVVGVRLRNARDRKNLKQTQVMEKTGINNKTLSGYENGVSEPDLDSLNRLAELYEVTTDYLTGKSDSPKGAVDEKAEANRVRAEKFSKLPPERQDQILELMRDWIKEDKNK